MVYNTVSFFCVISAIKEFPLHPCPHSLAACIFMASVAICLYIDKPHSQVFAVFRRFAVKKALASAKNAFSSFKQAISFACSLYCRLSFCASSVRLIDVFGVWGSGLKSNLASFVRLFHSYSVSIWTLSCFLRFAETNLSSKLYCLNFELLVIDFLLCHFLTSMIHFFFINP